MNIKNDCCIVKESIINKISRLKVHHNLFWLIICNTCFWIRNILLKLSNVKIILWTLWHHYECLMLFLPIFLTSYLYTLEWWKINFFQNYKKNCLLRRPLTFKKNKLDQSECTGNAYHWPHPSYQTVMISGSAVCHDGPDNFWVASLL